MREPDMDISLDGNPPVDFILWLRRKLREANLNAAEGARKWNVESERADRVCERLNYNYWQRRDHRKNNPYMADAMDKWSWWEREAKRFAEWIEAEMKILRWLEDERNVLPKQHRPSSIFTDTTPDRNHPMFIGGEPE